MRTKIHHFKVKNQNFSGEGAPPLPRPLPAPYPLGTFGASLLAPSALVPHSKILATPLDDELMVIMYRTQMSLWIRYKQLGTRWGV